MKPVRLFAAAVFFCVCITFLSGCGADDVDPCGIGATLAHAANKAYNDSDKNAEIAIDVADLVCKAATGNIPGAVVRGGGMVYKAVKNKYSTDGDSESSSSITDPADALLND